jgi:hypothetical protein
MVQIQYKNLYQFIGLEGNTVTIKKEELFNFKRSLYGKLLTQQDPEYNQACIIWNGMFQRYPTAIVQCRGSYDVLLSVNFAREHKIAATIKSGGHNITGSSIADRCLTIDLSLMNGVFVDPVKKIAMVQGGALLGDVDRETQMHGMAVPFGVVSKTGVAGLTLGGGYGHLRRKYGLTIDNLIAADMVLADGSFVHVNEKNHSDLFWAIRGGGGNFGVITMFEFKLHRIGTRLAFLYTVYALEDAREVLQKGQEFMLNKASEEISSEFQFVNFPDLDNIPHQIRDKRTLVLRGMNSGNPKEGLKAMSPLRSLGVPLYDSTKIMDYIEIQSYTDNDLPNGWNYYSTGVMLPEITTQISEVLIEEYKKVDFEFSAVTGLWHTGGAISSVKSDCTAYAARSNNFMVVIDCGWPNPSENDSQVKWGRNLKRRIMEVSPNIPDTGYINFQTGDNKKLEISAAYGDNISKLRIIKTKYDPSNFFRFNHNIPPL